MGDTDKSVLHIHDALIAEKIGETLQLVEALRARVLDLNTKHHQSDERVRAQLVAEVFGAVRHTVSMLPFEELMLLASRADQVALGLEQSRPGAPQVDDRVRVAYRLFLGRPEESFTGTITEARTVGPHSDRPGRRFYVRPDEGQGRSLAGWYSTREFEVLREEGQ